MGLCSSLISLSWGLLFGLLSGMTDGSASGVSTPASSVVIPVDGSGEGEMYEKNNEVSEPLALYKPPTDSVEIIRMLEARLQDKEKIIRLLESENTSLKVKLQNAGTREAS